MPTRKNPAVDDLVGARRSNQGDEPLHQLLCGHVQRRGAIAPGPLQPDPNPVTRQDVEPLLPARSESVPPDLTALEPAGQSTGRDQNVDAKPVTMESDEVLECVTSVMK